MIEFGSDFHKCDDAFGIQTHFLQCPIRYYANGRLPISALIYAQKWTRIWVPVYYCYDVVNHIMSTGIQVLFYDDYPLASNDDEIIRSLPFEDGDVLLRVNYFGLRDVRRNVNISVPVIEDHTHSLISSWCIKSDADWCVASIRKTIPVPAGGILWSPQNHSLPEQLSALPGCENMAKLRYWAMNLKANYLINGGEKDEFRDKFLFSEEIIESLDNSGMDAISLEIIQNFDVQRWYNRKRENWHILQRELCPKFNVVRSEDAHELYQFSLLIYCNSKYEREALRDYLIQNKVYPAILWKIPDKLEYSMALDFSDRMLSIHCDARYSIEDMIQLSHILNAYYD